MSGVSEDYLTARSWPLRGGDNFTAADVRNAAKVCLIGSTTGDQVGGDPYTGYVVIDINNGNYVVRSPYWDNGTAMNAGAVTWCSGNSSVYGPVNAANSLVGQSSNSNCSPSPPEVRR